MLTAVLCLVSIIGHPSSLECGTDATTRLIPGRQMVMSGDVTPPAQGVTPVVVQLKMVGKLLTAIAEVPNGNFFALRVMGGGTVAGTSNSTFVVPTKNCTAQVYSNDMVPYGNPTTTYVSFFKFSSFLPCIIYLSCFFVNLCDNRASCVSCSHSLRNNAAR